MMRWPGFVSMAAALVMGCGVPQDEGVVMACFGLVNETIPSPFSTEVVTNTYFGGCDPSDPGMQIIERATAAAAADQGIMTARCDIDCNARLVAYAAAHPEVTLPLSCQTLFAIPCEGLRSNVTSGAILQSGGPADTRFLLTGTVTVTVDGESSAVPAAGIVDGTLATTCQGVPESCPLTLSRLDVLGLESFPMGGVQVDSVHIQNQGLAVGSKSGGQIVIGAEAFEAEVNAVVGGALRAFHVRNDEPVQAGGDPTLEQFLSSLDITMTQGNVSVHIDMTGTPVGRRPVAAFTPQTTLYECPSSPCTVQLTSAASDPDDDLQSLSWLVDGVPQLGDASTAPATIDLVLPVGPHTVSLVATDSRGAASATSLDIHIGSAPVVMFTSPTANQVLCPAGSPNPSCLNDAVAGTPGWQGELTVHVSGGGAPITSGNVTFSVNGAPLGDPVALDSNGNATLPAATVPTGMQTIVATTDDIPNRGVGTGSVAVNVIDDIVPTVPLDLRTMVVDRRGVTVRLTWTAPNDSGGAVSGYQIRYAKVPIDASNFDNPSVTTAVPFTNPAIAAPGGTETVDVVGLYIENSYYFAMAATDAGGNRGPIASTPTVPACTCAAGCCSAHFSVTILPPPTGTSLQFGVAVDGSADLNGDGFSDLLVGTYNNGRAYLYLGGATFATSAPSVSFTAANPSYGVNVRPIGDIDGDGFQDLAISDQTGVRVLIYRGRASWPMTLADTQADYIITTDSSWAVSAFGSAIAALGDFDGDGRDDFVIGAAAFNTRVGRAVVIYGQAGFASFGLPNTTRSLEIAGDASLDRTQFGVAAVGIGHFYSVTSGTTLLVSAPGLGNATSTSANEGRIYAFHGRGPGAPISATTADHIRVGPGKGARIGQTLSSLGPVVNTLPAAGVGNAGDTLSVPGANGSAFVLSGTSASGPLANLLVTHQQGGASVGMVVFGGGFSGRDFGGSVIGNGQPDVALTGQSSSTLDIIDGARVPTLTSPVNFQTAADVHVALPSGWVGTGSGAGHLIRDINGDGFADFALADNFGFVPGRVAVFW